MNLELLCPEDIENRGISAKSRFFGAKSIKPTHSMVASLMIFSWSMRSISITANWLAVSPACYVAAYTKRTFSMISSVQCFAVVMLPTSSFYKFANFLSSLKNLTPCFLYLSAIVTSSLHLLLNRLSSFF